MNAKRVLGIGMTGDLYHSAFISDLHLDEFATVVWNPSALAKELGAATNSVTTAKLDQVRARLTVLDNWVRDGHCLVVLLEHCPAPLLSNTNHVFGIDAHEPFNSIVFAQMSGSQIAYCGPAHGIEKFAPWLGKLRYAATLSGAHIRPLLRIVPAVPGPIQLVGGYFSHGAGLVVIVPPVMFETQAMNRAANYAGFIAGIPDWLVTSTKDLPEWVNQHQTVSERKARDEISQLEARIGDLRGKIDARQTAVDDALALKHLFAASGQALTDAVASALGELGLQVVEGPHSRADLIATDGRRLAAIEVKGLDGSAREANLRQAHRWIAEVMATLTMSEEEVRKDADLRHYAEQLANLQFDREAVRDAGCKGVMIIGTFRKKSLDQRTEPDFPDAVLRPMKSSNVCGITGLQLLGLVLEARAADDKKQVLIDAIFETAGQLPLARDWRAYLTEPTEG